MNDLQRKIDVLQQGVKERRVELLLIEAWRIARQSPGQGLSPVGFGQLARELAEKYERS